VKFWENFKGEMAGNNRTHSHLRIFGIISHFAGQNGVEFGVFVPNQEQIDTYFPLKAIYLWILQRKDMSEEQLAKLMGRGYYITKTAGRPENLREGKSLRFPGGWRRN